MIKKVPKVAAIQDLSGYGRCSLTVVLPVLSCMGIQVCPVPTAILSTHMGGFGKPAVADLTDLLDNYMAHWDQLDLTFDAIYSGYLANTKQIHHVKRLIAVAQEKGSLVVIDPVMGDHGKLYASYTDEMIKAMKSLVKEADVITPNWTEACFLLDRPYSKEVQTSKIILAYVKALSDLGPKQVVITGVICAEGKKCNVVYDKNTGLYQELPYEEIPMHYPGTGDLFASVLVGRLLQGSTLLEGTEAASLFVKKAVDKTYAYGSDPKEGVLLEYVLPELLR